RRVGRLQEAWALARGRGAPPDGRVLERAHSGSRQDPAGVRQEPAADQRGAPRLGHAALDRALAHQPREPGLLGDPALAAERLLARTDRRDDAGRRDETDGFLAYPEAARAWAPLRQPARADDRGVRPAEPAPQRRRADRGAGVG